MTKTDVKTDTLFVTKTNTLPVTLTATSVVVESKFLTKTDTIKEILTNTITQTDVKVIPTTFTSVWVKTDVIDRVSFPDSLAENLCLQTAPRLTPSSALSPRLSLTNKR